MMVALQVLANKSRDVDWETETQKAEQIDYINTIHAYAAAPSRLVV